MRAGGEECRGSGGQIRLWIRFLHNNPISICVDICSYGKSTGVHQNIHLLGRHLDGVDVRSVSAPKCPEREPSIVESLLPALSDHQQRRKSLSTMSNDGKKMATASQVVDDDEPDEW